MSFEVAGGATSESRPCRFGASRLACRGPLRSLDAPYVAFLGSSETFGKYVAHPFAALIEAKIASPCVNLGSVNAGLDAFVHDAELVRIAARSRVAVLQVMGAQNLSNRFYRVHPRRNDRFLEATPQLAAIFPEVDFTEFNFNKHLLGALHARSPERFEVVRSELKQVWLGRMRLLLRRLGRQTVLLWLRYGAGQTPVAGARSGAKPMLIERDMVESLKPQVSAIVEIPVRTAGAVGELQHMACGPMQVPSASQMIGPTSHQAIAHRLAAELPAYLA